MSKIIKEIQFGDQKLVLETGEVARQADGSVLVHMNGTSVLVTAVFKKEGGESNSFFPLTVVYQERFYAAGRVPGGFLKREGRPSENETLIARLIDRPLRPLFPEGFKNEVQVVATVLSLNPEVSPDILALIGASAALSLSGVPFNGPIGGARVGYKDGIYLLNPSAKTVAESDLDLVVSGTDNAILMVESEAHELSEDVMLGAVLYGHEMMKNVIEAIKEMVEERGVQSFEWQAPAKQESLVDAVIQQGHELLEHAYLLKDKAERYQALGAARKQVIEALVTDESDYQEDAVKEILETIEKEIVRGRILKGEPRIDGRDQKTVRPISIRTGMLERTHGSVLFTRGETQALVVATLGNDRDAKIHDNVAGETKEKCMLHYNFPPFCVGETGMMTGPKRREIGHGNLARRAINAVLPDEKDCPFTIRLVSEIMESNGSSSMATVCGSSLALMDAGVQVKAPVAGVAMGLIKEGDDFAILTDILGDEDHLGDMDFKVAGTSKGVTALQMDIKIDGITKEIMEKALEQALQGRMHILGVMNETLSETRTELSDYAPQIAKMKVPVDKIRNVIGKGGSTIKGITESTGVNVDIDDNGNVTLFSPNKPALRAAEQMIKTSIAEVEVGVTYQGTVSKIVDFGAFITLLPGKDGLLHISQITKDRSEKVSAYIKEGDAISVLVEDVDKQGRVKLVWLKDSTEEEQAAEVEGSISEAAGTSEVEVAETTEAQTSEVSEVEVADVVTPEVVTKSTAADATTNE
jgi:polyribonucleotide nucleotidyltransferase